MHYRVVVFGVKDTTGEMLKYIHDQLHAVDLVISIDEAVIKQNDISGFLPLSKLTRERNIALFQTASYALSDEKCRDFFEQNEFDIGISMGWQRLIPKYVLDRFRFGVFGFHGSVAYLPYGRGRSPMNWSIINGDERFILNLFRYDDQADSPNVFENILFEITPHDTIRTLQYKNLLCSQTMVQHLLEAYATGKIHVTTASKDFDSWYKKRAPEDGKLDFHGKTRDIYNLIRGVTRPFPGAFSMVNASRVTIWNACPFDGVMDFSKYAPGEVIAVFDDNLIVRTVDGSIIITDYDAKNAIVAGDVFS